MHFQVSPQHGEARTKRLENGDKKGSSPALASPVPPAPDFRRRRPSDNKVVPN